MKLWNYIKKEMLKNPRQVISEGNKKITYQEMIKVVEKNAFNIKEEQCCAVFCSSELMAAQALLTCFAAGVTAVPLSLRYGEIHCKKIIDVIGPTTIITDEKGFLVFTKCDNSEYKIPKVHPALIMCTSGTTGIPKGVMLTEDNILTNLKDICDYFDINSKDRILIARPLYHCAVLTGEFLTSLIKGVGIVFYSEQFNPQNILNIIDKYDITVFCGTPTLVELISRFKRTSKGDSLRVLCVSGECMNQTFAQRIYEAFPNASIYHVYGLTEACPRVSYLPPYLFREYSEFVGIPLKSINIKILKKDGTIAKVNEEGVLWISGNNVMIGYYNSPEQTAKVFDGEWLCTGDMARIDSNGLLKIMGRNDDMIIRAGMNIYPQEIEGSLRMDSRVRDVLVYKVDNEYGTQIGLKISGDFTNVDEVKKMCQMLLPSFQIPSVIETLDELPKNGSGKIIRR